MVHIDNNSRHFIPQMAQNPSDLHAGYYPLGHSSRCILTELTGKKDITYDILYQYTRLLWEGIEIHETIPTGTHLFLSNHQCSYDIGYFSFLLGLLNGHDISMIGWDAMPIMHTGEVAWRLLSHPTTLANEYTQRFNVEAVDTYVPQKIMDGFNKIEARILQDAPRSICGSAAGEMERSEQEAVTRMSTMYLTLAERHNMNIYPVRFVWGNSHDNGMQKSLLPTQLCAQRAIIGPAITPKNLKNANLLQQRNLVTSAINDLWIPPTDEHMRANLQTSQRIDKLCQTFGVSRTKAIMFDAILKSDIAELTDDAKLMRHWFVESKSRWQADRSTWLWGFAMWVSECFSMGEIKLLETMYGPLRNPDTNTTL